MASGRFSKQALPFLSEKYLNSGTGEATSGGAITSAPSGLTVSQYQQNIPGDRIILSPVDALALSNNSVGNLYTGTFRYVGTRNNSTSGPVRGCGAFWDPLATSVASSAASDAKYQVTSDANNTAYSNTLFAGVYINNITKGNWGWIQESGKASCKFIATITAPTPTTNCGVYLPITPAANNNATDNGAFDQLVGANSAAIFQANSTTGYTTVEQMIMKYVGVAELIPSNNNISLVDITLSRASFRW